MQCGGTVKGYIKVFLPQNKLVIVGAGHVGQKINEIAKTLNFYTVVVDDREEYATKAYFPNSDEILVGDYNQVLGKYSLTENDYVVIVTRGQDNDLSSLRAVVNRRLAYIGMIGSARKIRYVMNELIKEGVEEEKLRGVYAPMGLDIASNTPVEIALSIMSEILLLKNNGTLNHRKNVRKVWE
jgi:xanthine dehydrogenase accessory factor